MTHTATAGRMTPAARRSIAAHAAIARHIRPGQAVASSPARSGRGGATFGPWAFHTPGCRCNVCR